MDKRAVYIFKTAGGNDFTGIVAGRTHSQREPAVFDTNRGHELPGKVTEETEKGFTFTSTGAAPGEWQFKVLTIEEFKRKYYKLAEGGQTMAAKLNTTDDLHQWYRREFKI